MRLTREGSVEFLEIAPSSEFSRKSGDQLDLKIDSWIIKICITINTINPCPHPELQLCNTWPLSPHGQLSSRWSFPSNSLAVVDESPSARAFNGPLCLVGHQKSLCEDHCQYHEWVNTASQPRYSSWSAPPPVADNSTANSEFSPREFNQRSIWVDFTTSE